MNSVIVFLHRRCTVGCAHCSARATPGKTESWRAGQLPALFARLQKADVAPHVIWTGGEPFLTANLLVSAVRAAGKAGFQSEILTSGGIFPGTRCLDLLAGVRGTRLRISLDHLHQRRIPMEAIVKLAGAAAGSGMEVCFTLREIPGQPPASRLLSHLRSNLPELFAPPRRGRFLHHIPHLPLDEEPAGSRVKAGSPIPDLPCRNGFRDLVAGEDGNLYPCCGAVSFRHRDLLTPGNILEDQPRLSQASLTALPLNNLLFSQGPSGLALALGIHPHSVCPPPIEHSCRLCYTLFRFYGAQIRSLFPRRGGGNRSQ